MLKWSLVFLALALVAALFGFGGLIAGAAAFVEILFYVFLSLFIITLIANVVRGTSTAIPA